jgi:hypothetical protein
MSSHLEVPGWRNVGGLPISTRAGHQNLKLKLRNGKKLDSITVPRLIVSILGPKIGEGLFYDCTRDGIAKEACRPANLTSPRCQLSVVSSRVVAVSKLAFTIICIAVEIAIVTIGFVLYLQVL